MARGTDRFDPSRPSALQQKLTLCQADPLKRESWTGSSQHSQDRPRRVQTLFSERFLCRFRYECWDQVSYFKADTGVAIVRS